MKYGYYFIKVKNIDVLFRISNEYFPVEPISNLSFVSSIKHSDDGCSDFPSFIDITRDSFIAFCDRQIMKEV